MPGQYVTNFMKSYPDFNKRLLGYVRHQQIDWLCKHDDFHQKLLIFLREHNFLRRFPIEDVIEMENGTIEVTDDGPRY